MTVVQASTIVDILSWRAINQPERLAYTFLADGEAREVHLTYAELDLRARAIAAALQSHGAAGERALLLYPPGLEFITAFFGCLYAKAAAVPAYPPRLNRSLIRLQAVIADAQASAVLTTAQTLSRVSSLPQLQQSLSWLATDEIDNGRSEDWEPTALNGETLALIQYTSGSTNSPKGVMISHANLLSNGRAIQWSFDLSARSIIFGWLPLYHDMGLIGNVLQPLYAGARCILMSPQAFLQKPFRWLDAISRYRATVSGAPNFAYELCARRVSPDERRALDLSCWEVAFNGAEPVRHNTLDLFTEAFGLCGFRREAFLPCYGLAEATLLVAAGDKHTPPLAETFDGVALSEGRAVAAGGDHESRRTLVGCGRGQRILIVDPQTLIPCPPGRIGEIWISRSNADANVASGYWNRPEETADTFQARLNEAGGEAESFLRTGDLGFLKNGELFVTGRLKDLIIIRGLNHYPQDIERTVEEAHPKLRPGCGAAFSVDIAGEERLVVVQEIDHRHKTDLKPVIESIRQAVAENHDLQCHAIVLVRPGGVPKTTSGKIQRHACRESFLGNSLDIVDEWRASAISEDQSPFPKDDGEARETVEAFLVKWLSAKLGVHEGEIDVNQPIARYGLDSLLAVELTCDLEALFGIEAPISDLLQNASIAELAWREEWRAAPATGKARLKAGDDQRSDLPLSRGQAALYFINQLAPESAAYNIAHAVRIRSDLNAQALKRAFQRLVARHSMLRSQFLIVDGKPARRIDQSAGVFFREEDASLWDAEALERRLDNESQSPFDLSADPLLRVFLFKTSHREHVLLLVVHHIIADFWSLAVLTDELEKLYAAENAGRERHLPLPPVSYSDYVDWQEEILSSEEGASRWQYWRRRLAGEPPPLDLPTDKPRQPIQTYRGSSEAITLDKELTRRLKALGSNEVATLQMTLIAAFAALLHRYTRQEDILIGAPESGRARAEFARVVGYFANPVVLRMDLNGDVSFVELLHRARQATIEAIERPLPFPMLVERLQLARDPSRSPVFQVMFVMQKSPTGFPENLAALALGEAQVEIKMGELALETTRLNQQIAQFDLTMMAAEISGRIAVSLQYNTDLFEGMTIRRMLGHFKTMLEAVAAEPGLAVARLPLLGNDERRQMLYEWNNTKGNYPQDVCLHHLIEEQAERSPDAIAVVFEDQQLTYEELNRRSNQLARFLRSFGAGPDTLVAICVERSVEMAHGLLSILKAGAAYLPLDPDYPRERLAFMLKDSAAQILLTRGRPNHLPSAHTAQYIDFEIDRPRIARESSHNLAPGVDAANLAYVIYTSGSTGEPKGAMNTHAGIVNRLLWMQEAYRLTPDDRVLQKTPLSFDVSVWEVFWPLLAGAQMIVARPGGHRDSDYLVQTIYEQQITTAHFVPSLLSAFVEEPGVEKLSSLKRIIASGEALPRSLVERFYERLNRATLHNLYGPTEAAVDVTAWRCAREDERASVPIGRAIANMGVYALDDQMALAPVGAPGELYLGGIGVGRGYVDRPDLTAAAFLPDPFNTEAGARIYKTGDLARYLSDGAIEFLGRLDHQVKIRGHRIELSEIEAALRRRPEVRDAVVVVKENGAESSRSNRFGYRVTENESVAPLTEYRRFLKGEAPLTNARTNGRPVDKRLVAYLVCHRALRPDIAELRRFVGETLPDYMVPASFVFLDALPLTPNGKVDRRALPEPGDARPELSAEFVAPGTRIEAELAEIWSQALGVKRIGVDDNYFDLGGDSIRSIQIRARALERGIVFSLQDMFQYQTIRHLAGAVESEGWDRRPVSPRDGGTQPFSLIADEDRRKMPDGVEDAYPLSRVQAGLIYHLQYNPGSAIYHDIFVYDLQAPFDAELLKQAAQQVVDRHPILRTSFDMTSFTEPLQLAHKQAPAAFEVIDLRSISPEQQKVVQSRWIDEQKKTQIALTHPSQIRFFVHRLRDDRFQLILSFYDTILDGWSTASLLTELLRRYLSALDGAPPPVEAPPAVSYRDFIALERATIASEEVKRFWDVKLAGATITQLPRWVAVKTRNEAPLISALHVPISIDVSQGLKRAARLAGTHVKHVLLAAHLKVMSALSGQADVLTGLETNGRLEESEGERALGMHINTAPFRQKLSGGAWIELIKDAYGAEQELLPFRRYPLFELQKRRGRQALFETVFNYTHFHIFYDLQNHKNLTVLGAWGFEETNFTLRAEFNHNPFLDRIQLDLAANLREITSEQLESIGRYYATTLDAIAENPSARYETWAPLSPQEMQTILFEWNGAVANRLEDRSILDLIRAQARRSPHAVAVKFGEENLTYDELDRRSNQLAHYLLAKGCEAETRVGVCLPRALDLIVGLLGILKAGGVCAPLDPAYPPERTKFMLEDAQVSLVLTREGLGVLHEVEQIRLDSDWEIISHANADDPASTSAGATLANLIYVIYTSGSTGRPKGVALPLDALTNLLNWQLKNFTAQGAVKTLQFTSLNFDVSFQEILSTLCSGGTLVLLTETQRRDPAQMLHLIEDEKIERLFMPFVALQRLAEAAMQEARFPESLREIVTAGEQLEITPAVGNFFKRLSGCALHNQYGPSESHVVTAHTLAGSPEDWPHLPPIGRPIANARVYLLDQHLNPAPVAVSGELHIGGTGLARGYINGPDQTAERFIPDPFSSEPGARLYRTGDIAQHTQDGLLRFLGRIDQQVKIRGYRIEPGEVEAALNEHPSVHQGVVTVKDDPLGVNRLVAYVVSRPDDGQAGGAATAGELRRFLGLKLPEYMIPTAFVPMERLPLTPSGKIDRMALPAPGHARPEVNEDYAPPRTPAEEVLAAIWARVLGVERVGVYDNFFELGGDSLLATQVVSHLREAFKVELPVRVLFEEANTIAQLAEAVETLARADQGLQRPPLWRVSRNGLLPTSFAQQRLCFLSRLTPDNATYNVPAAVRLRGPLDVSALERSVNEVVRRHEALRTTFDERDGRPIQAPAPESKISVSIIEMQNVAGPERDRDVERHIREEARRPFDLMRGPLLRVTLLRLNLEEHVAMLTMHHIVSDGWSVGVLIRELATLYESFVNGARPNLNELPIQYADYAVWQREWLQGDRLESLSSYWKRKLGGLATLELPTDRPRPKVMKFEGTVQTLRLPQPLRESLKSLGRDESATLFMTLLAAFKVLLHYFTKQTDIVVGTDVANRNPAETEKLIGFFVNQLVLRTDLSGDPTFRELLGRVREVALEAYAYQEMPFDKLVETLNPPREANRAPLFQVKFVLQNAPTPDLEMAGLRLSLMETHSGTAKFDLLFNMWEMEEGLFGLIEYSTELFDPGSIARLLGHYELILRQAAAAPQTRLGEFEDQLIEADAQRLKAEEQRRRQTQHSKFMKTKPSKFRSGRSKDDEAK